MDVYVLLLYVTKEQEEAIQVLFAKRQWLFCKSDSAHLSSPKQTIILYDNLTNSQPKIYTVSDVKGSHVYTTHEGNLIETTKVTATQHEKIEPVETLSLTPNTVGTKVPTGLKECSVKIRRMPGKKEKKIHTTTNIKKRGRPKTVKSGRLKSPAKDLKVRNTPVSETDAHCQKTEKELKKENVNEVESKYETSEEIMLSSTTDLAKIKEVNAKVESEPEDDAEEMDDDNDNDEDYKPVDEDRNDSSEDIDRDEKDPDYHYGDRFSVLQKKKKSQIQKRKTFSCEKCKKTYKFKRGYLNHLKDGVCQGPVKKKRKKDEMAGLGSYFCETCKKIYTYKRKYNAHFIDGRCNRQCKYCNKVFSKNMLSRHIFYKHELEDERLRCEVCKKRFYGNSELSQHMHSHDSEGNFVCDFCGKAFFLYSSLYVHKKRHVQNLTGVKAHCNICNKDFSDVGYLVFHKKVTHLKVKNCMCEICGKKFKTARCVKQHMRAHSDERPFQCDVCGKYYKYSHQLSSHTKMFHSKLKRFFCKVCNKGFYFEGKLRDHMNIHTGTRAHQCPQCNYSSFTRIQLTQHKRKHRQPKNELEKAESTYPFAC